MVLTCVGVVVVVLEVVVVVLEVLKEVMEVVGRDGVGEVGMGSGR